MMPWAQMSLKEQSEATEFIVLLLGDTIGYYARWRSQVFQISEYD